MHQRRRHARRPRSRRQLRTFLFALGLVGLILGATFLVMHMASARPIYRTAGLIYVFGAVSVLSARQALAVTHDELSRAHRDRVDGETREASDEVGHG